jgi:major membrane immunogen (membrane-anchored lipoprotein)
MRQIAVLTFTAALLLTGCGKTPQAPLQNLTRNTQCVITSSQFSNGIITAAEKEGWNIQKFGKANLQAVREEDGKMARIAISYSKTKYYLTYLDSKGMRYDGKQIDATYNIWLHQLRRAVNSELVTTCKQMPQPVTTAKPVSTPKRVIQKPETERSVLTPETKEAPIEEIESPVMIESVPTDIMIVN